MTETTATAGNHRGRGAPKGSKNRKGTITRVTQSARDKLIAAGYDPIDAMIKVAQDAEAAGEMGYRLAAAKELARYTYPVLKAIEHNHNVQGEIKLTTIKLVPLTSPEIIDA